MAAALLTGALAAGCASSGSRGPQFPVIDLIRWFRTADARPVHGRFELGQHTLGGDVRATLYVPVPSRIVWQVRVPRRATLHITPALHAASGLGTVRFRVGISDRRIYEPLTELTLSSPPAASSPRSLHVDLSAYAGWQWSLFYRPETSPWRLVLAADPIDGNVAHALWVEPAIYTDMDAARRFRALLRRRSAPPVTGARD